MNLDNYNFNLGTYQKKITTNSDQAQLWFDRALLWMYSFNHEEGRICCEKALEYDPNTAMIYYLKSFSLGINYNDCPEQLNPLQAQEQYLNWQKANELKEQCTELEKDLINALKYRVGDGKSLEYKNNSELFSQEMRKVYHKYSQDEFVAEIFAESLMNLRPWNLWVQRDEPEKGLKYGDPYPNTLEIKDVIWKGLQINPNHIGLRHLWIHLMELSPYPEQALESNFNQPLSQICKDSGHLCHMPTHIDILCGRYEEAIQGNEQGIINDNKYFEYREKMGYSNNCIYIAYRCHNIHFLSYSAMFAGNYQKALEAGQFLVKILHFDCLKGKELFVPYAAFWLESFVSIVLHVHIRFGKWEEIIGDQPFGQNLQLKQVFDNPDLYLCTICMLHYAKGISYSVLAGKQQSIEEKQNFLKKAEEQIQLFIESFKKVDNNRYLHNNNMNDVFKVGHDMLIGEYEYRCGNYEKAFKYLRSAVQKDDNLPYDEPWGWMVPTRHALGALLLEYGSDKKNNNYLQCLQEAEKVYRQDLGEGVIRAVAHPANIWSLIGLHRCLTLLNKNEEANTVKVLLDQKMQYCDIPINASCMCSLKQF